MPEQPRRRGRPPAEALLLRAPRHGHAATSSSSSSPRSRRSSSCARILAATGWPQLGGGKIHFAHLLWGGIGMLLAFILFMAMQGRLWDLLATLSAGIGFGLFLDELGKFITSDNDYFFQPAVAIMYVLFVVLFFLSAGSGASTRCGRETALVNSFDFAKEAVMRAMDEGERDEALYVLGRADQSDPMVRRSRRMLSAVTPPPASTNAAARA